MRRAESPETKTLRSLLANKTLPRVLVAHMRNGNMARIAGLLNAMNYEFLDDEDKPRAFDLMQETYAQLEGVERQVFLALADKGLGLFLRAYSNSEKDFIDGYIRHYEPGGKEFTRWQTQYDALAHHPFVKAYRDELRYVTDDAALGLLAELWKANKTQEFLFLYSALLPIKGREQYQRDRHYNEESFTQKITSHPDLELVVLNVARGTDIGNEALAANLPKMRMIVSNKAKPMMYDETPAGDAKGEPDFWILVAGKTYTDLKSYMKDSLAAYEGSRGFGPYNFISNDDRTYPTAANAIAVLQDAIRVPNNYMISAQDRMREQIDAIHDVALGKIYGHRFLRQTGWSDWAAALLLAGDNSAMRDVIGFREAAQVLVTHGFTRAADTLEHVVYDGEDKTPVYEGFRDGINALYRRMQDLAGGKENETNALLLYQQEFGFHPDVLLFPVSDRKKLAFQDAGNMMVAHLCGDMILPAYLHEDAAVYPWQKGRPILAEIPVQDIAKLYVDAGDVTNFMRLLEHWEGLELEEHADALSAQLKKAAYYVSPEFTIRALNDLEGRAVFESNGTLHVRTGIMLDFKTADQIVKDEIVSEAVAAYQVLKSFTFPKESVDVQANVERQKKMLADFVGEIAAARSLAKLMDEAGLAPEERPLFFKVIENMLPGIAAVEGYKNGQTLDQTASVVEAVAKGAERLMNPQRPSRYERIVTAARQVAGLWSKPKR